MKKPLALLCLLAGMLVAGCAGREELYRQLDHDRASAFSVWQQEHANRQKSHAFLKGKLGLSDAISLALKYNRDLQSMVEEKARARGRVIESYSAALPSFKLEGAYSRLDSRHNLGAAFLDNYSADLTVVQPLFRGGAIPGALRAARLYACLADEVVRGQVQSLVFQVASAYYDVLLARHMYRVNQDAVKSAQAHLDDVKKRRAVGEAAKFDVLRAQVDVSNFRTEMIRQRNSIAIAKTRLLRIMGVSQQSTVKLSDKLVYEKMQPVLEQAIKLALTSRPDLFQAELGIRLQREAVRIARSRYWPTLAATLVQGLAKPDPHESTTNNWGDQWTAGLTLSWDLFDGMAREGKLRQERAILRQKKIALADTQEKALFEIQQAILRLHDAEEAVESQKLNLDRAKEALRLAEVGYREGVTTEVAVTDARSALTTAQGLYYQAVHSHIIARLSLQQAMGILAPIPGSSEVPANSPVPPARISEFQK